MRGKIKLFYEKYLRNYWMNFSMRTRMIIALIIIIVAAIFGLLVADAISWGFNSIHDWLYNRQQQTQVEIENEAKSESTQHEANANALTPQIEAEKANANVRAAETKQAEATAAKSKLKVNEAVKHYEQIKKSRTNNRNNSDAISDDELCSNGKIAGVEIDGCSN